MSRNGLRSGDIALLGQLNLGPLVLGDIPDESVERLATLGLARKVLGSCKITQKGQLSLHRRSFATEPRPHPLFLQKTWLRVQLSTRWLKRLSSQTAGRVWQPREAPAQMAGNASPGQKHEPSSGSQ